LPILGSDHDLEMLVHWYHGFECH